MEPRPGPSATPNRDDGPFSPGDVVSYDNGPRVRWYRNWLEESGSGIVLGCRERGGRGTGYWFCTVETRVERKTVGQGWRVTRGSYKAATLKLQRQATTSDAGWVAPPVTQMVGLRASEV